jgi:hypothetical protein
MAMDAYAAAIVLGDIDPAKAKIAEQLRSYCKLDTWAMVRVWAKFTDHKLPDLDG